jgi:hypothetical protein
MGKLDDNAHRDEIVAQPLSVMPFKKVMDCLTANKVQLAHEICVEHKFRPKLGQLLIATGRLSASDLDSMLVVHDAKEIKEVPMGRLLVIAGLLSPDELSHYFELQRMLRFPSRQQDGWARTLLAQGLITQDQLNTALNDQQLKNITLEEALIGRGWLTEEMINSHDSAAEADTSASQSKSS